jgi:hypothetical protein
MLIQIDPYHAWDAHYRILELIAPIREFEEGELSLMDNDLAPSAHSALRFSILLLPLSQNPRKARPSQARLFEVC